MGITDWIKKKYEEHEVVEKTRIDRSPAVREAYRDARQHYAIMAARERARDEFKRRSHQGSGWGSGIASGLGLFQSSVSRYQKGARKFSKTYPGLTGSYFGSMYGSKKKHHKKHHKHGKSITINLG